MARGDVEEVRARADILELVGAHVRLRRAGRNYVGLCPFHDEKTPSFSVNAERGFFHCFGCGVGGTVFDFVMKTEGLNFAEALQSLAQRYGIALAETRGGMPSSERDALAAANATAAEFFAHVLWNTNEGAAARDYLKARAITTETAKAFIIGFAPARPANLAAVMQKRGLTDGALKVGLIKRDPDGGLHDMFRARLMFPIRDPQGRVIAFGGRVLDQRLPKYINSTESPLYSKARTVYGICEARPAISKADRAIVVEGYIDAIALWQAGFKETVASLGTALTVEQLRLLGRYTKNVIACFDGDTAGRKASLRALEVFLGAGMTGRGVFIPTGFDPDTLVRERGAQALSDLIASSELLADFFLNNQAAAPPTITPAPVPPSGWRRSLRWSRIPSSSICSRAKRPACLVSAKNCCAGKRASAGLKADAGHRREARPGLQPLGRFGLHGRTRRFRPRSGLLPSRSIFPHCARRFSAPPPIISRMILCGRTSRRSVSRRSRRSARKPHDPAPRRGPAQLLQRIQLEISAERSRPRQYGGRRLYRDHRTSAAPRSIRRSPPHDHDRRGQRSGGY